MAQTPAEAAIAAVAGPEERRALERLNRAIQRSKAHSPDTKRAAIQQLTELAETLAAKGAA